MINKKHLDEWSNSSDVDESIIHKNAQSLTDKKVIAQKLNWKSWNYPFGGWWCGSLNLETMQPHEYFGQFKPDNPIQLNGKPSKYLTPKNLAYDAIALQHSEADYWQALIDDRSMPLVITEGAKKAGHIMSCGFHALALIGVWMGEGTDRNGRSLLVPNLKILAVTGRPIVFAFDADLYRKTSVKKALISLATELNRKECKVNVAVW